MIGSLVWQLFLPLPLLRDTREKRRRRMLRRTRMTGL
jgi:hypothetical protein